MAPGLVWRHRPCIAFVYHFSARLQQRLQPRQPRPTTTRTTTTTTTTTSSNHDSHDNNHKHHKNSNHHDDNHYNTTATTTTQLQPRRQPTTTTRSRQQARRPPPQYACNVIPPEGLTFLSSLSTYGSQIELNSCIGDEGSLGAPLLSASCTYY